jgi:ribosomal protein S27E
MSRRPPVPASPVFAAGAAESQKEGRMKPKKQAAEVACPRCHRTEIVYLPIEEMPKCPDCRDVRMVFRELLTEGKSY